MGGQGGFLHARRRPRPGHGRRVGGPRRRCRGFYSESVHRRRHRKSRCYVDAYQRHVASVIDAALAGNRGLEACRAMRREFDVAIVVITSSTHEDATVAAFEAGAVDCLVKPFRARELIARARSVIRRAPLPDHERLIEIGDVRLDPSEFEVQLRGERIDVTRLEFALLRVLMANAGRPVSRHVLVEAVWGLEARVPKTVETHIWRLRLKLEDARCRPTELSR